MKKKDYYNVLIIIGIVAIIMLVTTGFGNLYGSKTDWGSQHWAIPEYFRTLYYETGQLFPNYAPNIGAGQNIYNFSYYGLLNPIILISYLLPFVKMVEYIMVSSILIVFISIYLFYKWINSKGYNSKVVFLSTLFFALANPLIYHSHRHIMFINYIPFLLLGLAGVDKYFSDKKSWLLTLSITLMILTSYFYSVGGLLVLAIYSLHKIFKIEGLKLKNILLEIFKLLIPVIIGIGMAAILLLPTIAVITGGRGTSATNLNLFKLLIPSFNLVSMMYSSYSLGLTGIAVISLIYALVSNKKKYKVLGILTSIVVFIPLIVYLLNGMLYIRYKVLIPFLPIFGLLIADFIDGLLEKKIDLKKLIVASLIVIVFSINNSKYALLYVVDIFLQMFLIYFYIKKDKEQLIFIPLITIAIISSLVVNFSDNLVTIPQYNDEFNLKKEQLINEVINNDNSYYRFSNFNDTLSTSNKIYHPRYNQVSMYSSTYNNLYNDFYYDVFKNAIPYRNRVITAQSSNILFQVLMGSKYIGTSESEPIGYKKIKASKNGFNIYSNESVFSLGYFTNKVMSLEDFEKLKYPYTLEPILNGVVAPSKTNYKYDVVMKKVDLKYSWEKGKELSINKKGDKYIIRANNNDRLKLKLIESYNNQIMIIKFKIDNNQSCKIGDVGININGIRNKLTCKEWIYHNENYEFEYVVSSNQDINELNIDFDKGEYNISNVEVYLMDYDEVIKYVEEKVMMSIDIDKVSGNLITGNISVPDAGYFVTTIPYEKGLKVKLNDNIQELEIVNKAFVGFPISKGDYKVEIIFEPPLFKAGTIISGISLISYIGLVLIERKYVE